jgi:hypothetical protein
MDRPADELLRRILTAAASEVGGPDVQRLVAEARAEAAEEFKGILKSAMKAALLRAAAEQLEPEQLASVAPGKDTGVSAENQPPPTACYLYAITAAGPDPWPADMVGVDGTRPPEFVRHGDLQAIVSHVPLDEFGQAGLDDCATDPNWVEEKVRAHDRVIKQAMAGGRAVIPCRFCTVLRGTDDVRRLLNVHGNGIRATLAELGRKQEWGVKVYARQPAEVAREVAESLVGAAEAGPASGHRVGTAYLQRRRHEDALRAEVERAARSRAAACHEELAALADEAVVLPRRSNGARRAADEPVMNGAYLVPEARVEPFHAAVAELQERNAPLGLAFEVTGPWPPYNFVRLDLSLGAET